MRKPIVLLSSHGMGKSSCMKKYCEDRSKGISNLIVIDRESYYISNPNDFNYINHGLEYPNLIDVNYFLSPENLKRYPIHYYLDAIDYHIDKYDRIEYPNCYLVRHKDYESYRNHMVKVIEDRIMRGIYKFKEVKEEFIKRRWRIIEEGMEIYPSIVIEEGQYLSDVVQWLESQGL